MIRDPRLERTNRRSTRGCHAGVLYAEAAR